MFKVNVHILYAYQARYIAIQSTGLPLYFSFILIKKAPKQKER